MRSEQNSEVAQTNKENSLTHIGRHNDELLPYKIAMTFHAFTCELYMEASKEESIIIMCHA